MSAVKLEEVAYEIMDSHEIVRETDLTRTDRISRLAKRNNFGDFIYTDLKKDAVKFKVLLVCCICLYYYACV